MSELINLTKYLKIENAAHILYTFECIENYINNMIAYIKAGIEMGHHLLIIENSNTYKQVEEKIKSFFSVQEQMSIHYLDNYLFYGYYGNFRMNNIIEHFRQVLTPFLNNQINVRTWAHVEWQEQKDIFAKIEEFEKLADYSVNKMKLMSVCAYDASDICASLHINMMRTHEYIMTDKEFVKSSLYRVFIK